jgi:glycosyltransferase involved in cell wall biosynthesis
MGIVLKSGIPCRAELLGVDTLDIVFVAPMSLPIPSEKGAIEDIILQVARRLKGRFRVFVFNPRAKTKFSKMVMGLTFNLMRRSDADPNSVVLHSHNLYASITMSMWFGGSRKHVLTLHYPPWVTRDRARFYALLSSLKLLYSRNVIITAPSKPVVRWLVERGVGAVFVPNGVDVDLFNPALKSWHLRERLLGDAEVLVVSLGRIHPAKNQLAIVKALYALRRRNELDIRRLRVVLVGPVGGFDRASPHEYVYYRTLVEAVRKYGLDSVVKLLGEVERKRDVARILASSDIYVHPSVVEAAPLAVLEAMASGLPILAFDMPFYEGYLYDGVNALLVKPLDPVALSSGLLRLVEDSALRKKLSQGGLRIVREVFSWDVLVRERYVPLYLQS